MSLSQAWRGLARRHCVSDRLAQAACELLLAAYAEPQRHYHTIAHIEQLLRLLDEHGSSVTDRDALVLAILFHDIVYDPMRQDNEAASARLAAEQLASLGLPHPLIAKVERYILATRHGQDAEATDDADLALFLDLDLAILAATRSDYRAYAEAIRREYQHVPDALYRSGRRKVLEGFLARDRIYQTRLGALWEAPARANLADEIARLAA